MKFEERLALTLTSGDSKIFGILHLPLKTSKAPCVLFCGGFGGFKSGKYRIAVRQAEALSKLGIASLRFDYRGCGDSEGNFSDLTIKSQIEDTLCCLNYLQSHESIGNIGLCARSMGAVIATKITQEFPIKAACLWVPVFDFSIWLEGRIQHRAIRFEESGPTFAGQKLNQELLREFSAFSAQMIDDIPVCIIHAGQDQVLGSHHFEQYVAAREKAMAETQTHVLPKSNHDFNIPEEQEILIATTTAWFAKHLCI